jgi:aspartyl-tRNA(Asn)/glutamyl-tRNA(Gln) amidotransferase subunit C
MSLSRAEVEKVALLARLELSPEQAERMASQLGQIIEYVRQLSAVDTSGVEPMAHAIELANVFADDQPGESLAREAALSNAPQQDGECYLVPAVLGDG